MIDKTEAARRVLVQVINMNPPQTLEEIREIAGEAWDTAGLIQTFIVDVFAAPFVVVMRKADGVRGTLMFQHHPRVYWGFVAAEKTSS